MSNELIKTNLDEILSKTLDNLTLSEKGSLAFEVHNVAVQLETLLKKLNAKKNEITNNIAKEIPYELDENGKLLNTQIINKVTGEAVGILEWYQDKDELLDEERALKTLNASTGMNLTNEIFYEVRQKTKTISTLKRKMSSTLKVKTISTLKRKMISTLKVKTILTSKVKKKMTWKRKILTLKRKIG